MRQNPKLTNTVLRCISVLYQNKVIDEEKRNQLVEDLETYQKTGNNAALLCNLGDYAYATDFDDYVGPTLDAIYNDEKFRRI